MAPVFSVIVQPLVNHLHDFYKVVAGQKISRQQGEIGVRGARGDAGRNQYPIVLTDCMWPVRSRSSLSHSGPMDRSKTPAGLWPECPSSLLCSFCCAMEG